MKRKTIWIVTALLFSVIAIGQVTVKGKVLDIKLVPLVGVNVVLKGSATNTITDFDGNYSLTVPSGQSEIEFSYIGFNSKLVKVGERCSKCIGRDSGNWFCLCKKE
jgi:hypothetical protein